MRIEGEDQRIYEVDFEVGRCSCGTPSCRHLRRVQAIAGGWRPESYVTLSALHKAIRRCRPDEAATWAKLYDCMNGPGAAAKYLGKVVGEEARALGLWRRIRSGELRSPDEIVNQIARCRKKFELDYLVSANHFEAWLNAFHRVVGDPEPWDRVRLRTLVHTFDTPEAGYMLYFITKTSKRLKAVFWTEIEARAAKDRNKRLQDFLVWAPSGGYARLIATELSLSLYNEQEADDMHLDRRPTDDLIPAIPPWAQDQHVSAGLRLMKRYWPEITTNSLRVDSGLDLRYSGSCFGVVWREECFRQHRTLFRSDGVGIPWDNVHINGTLWGRIPAMELFFYRRLRQAGLTAPDLATPSIQGALNLSS